MPPKTGLARIEIYPVVNIVQIRPQITNFAGSSQFIATGLVGAGTVWPIIGLAAGRMLSGIGGWGLDFAMVAAFIAMVLRYVKDKPNLVASLSALAFHGLPHKLGLIAAAILGISAGVIAERLLLKGSQSVAAAMGNE